MHHSTPYLSLSVISTETTTTTNRRARYGYAHSISYVAIVKASKFVPQERISGRICEHVVDVSIPQVVEQLFVVLKISSQTESCTVLSNRFLAVPVPRMIEQFVEMPKVVSQDRIQQRTLEQISDTPVPQVVEELVGLLLFSPDGVQHRSVELIFETLAMSLAEVFTRFSQDRAQQHHVEQIIETASRISLTEEMKEVPKIKGASTAVNDLSAAGIAGGMVALADMDVDGGYDNGTYSGLALSLSPLSFLLSSLLFFLPMFSPSPIFRPPSFLAPL